jgi:hypothetical protein
MSPPDHVLRKRSVIMLKWTFAFVAIACTALEIKAVATIYTDTPGVD